MQLLKAIPVLPAISMSDTIDFYEHKLSFKGINLGNYAIIKYNVVEIHFCLIADKNKLHTSSCYIYTDDIESLYTKLAEKNLLYPGGEIKSISGQKEFSIKDNNGNIIRFGEQR
jgi:hypothetical protein